MTMKVYSEQTVPAIPTAFFSHSSRAESVGCPSPEYVFLCFPLSTIAHSIQPYWGLLRKDIRLTHICHIFWFSKISGNHASSVLHLWKESLWRRSFPSSCLRTGLDSQVVDNRGRYAWLIIIRTIYLYLYNIIQKTVWCHTQLLIRQGVLLFPTHAIINLQ